jgi:hypothetical protein
MLVVECVIRREIQGLISTTSAGYAICDIFSMPAGPTSVDLIKGTPRNIKVDGG